jgi:hypothetical protein
MDNRLHESIEFFSRQHDDDDGGGGHFAIDMSGVYIQHGPKCITKYTTLSGRLV